MTVEARLGNEDPVPLLSYIVHGQETISHDCRSDRQVWRPFYVLNGVRIQLPPAADVALGLLLGALLAPRVEPVPTLLLVVLALLGACLRRRWGWAVVAFAVGIFHAQASWLDNARRDPGWRTDLPVTGVFAPGADGWQAATSGWSARGQLLRLEQSERSAQPRVQMRVTVSAREPPPPASSYSLKGYLQRPTTYYNPDPTAVGWWQFRVGSSRLVKAMGPASSESWVGRIRATAHHAVSSCGEGAGVTVATALALGDSQVLPTGLRMALRRAGLSHLFAISGLHVGLLAATVLFAAYPLRPLPRTVLALSSVATYVVIVGPSASVSRAAVMVSAVLAARLSRRPPSSINGLALAVLLLLALSPAAAHELSFRLTVAATFGILVLAPSLRRHWPSIPGGGPLSVALGAQLATLPLVVPAFSLLPVGSLLLNVVAIPWIGLCLVLCLGWSVVAIISTPIASALVPLLDLVAAPFGWLELLPPGALLSMPLSWSFLRCLIFSALVAALLTGRRLALVGLVAFFASAPSHKSSDLGVIALDVGQGDALLLRDGAHTLLIDGGGWRSGDFGGRVLVPALARVGVRSLEAAIISHADWDHCGGVADLAFYVPVRELWLSPGVLSSSCGRRLLDLAGPTIRVLWRGHRRVWHRWSFEVLHPAPGSGQRGNEGSLVIHASAGGRSLLLTGDIGEVVERALIVKGSRLDSDILKVAHHGSRFSSGRSFLDAVSPRRAIISVGRGNSYGHPTGAVLDRLEARRTQVLRTDLHGRIDLSWRPGGPPRVATATTPMAPGAVPRRHRIGRPGLLE